MSKAGTFAAALDSYWHYTQMPWGRLFYQTAWDQIDRFLGEQTQAIMDIGCGFGISSNEYSRKGHRVTAVEPAHEMIELAKRLDRKCLIWRILLKRHPGVWGNTIGSFAITFLNIRRIHSLLSSRSATAKPQMATCH